MLVKSFNRLFYGTQKLRKSRLHDEKNNFVGWRKLLTHAPKAVLTGLLRISVGYRPSKPWIAYDAINYLEEFLNEDSRVLEFGSGMSTVWYAAAAGEVYSIDNYRSWFDNVKALLEKKGLENVHYCFAETPEEYCNFQVDNSEGFDLVMVDGSMRDECMATAVKVVKPGGIVYLDNSDRHEPPTSDNITKAEELALTLAKEKSAKITYFTDFAPTQFFVQQGMMVILPA